MIAALQLRQGYRGIDVVEGLHPPAHCCTSLPTATPCGT
jgi:hypothetical protein